MSLKRFRAIAMWLTIASVLSPAFLKFLNMYPIYAPSQDMATDFVTGLLWAVLLGASILIWPIKPENKRLLLEGWLIKCSVSLGLMLVYEYYYEFSLDSVGYYTASMTMLGRWEPLKFGDGTWNMFSLLWLHRQLIPNSYHAAIVTFSMIGLVALYLFYRGSAYALGREDKRFFYAMLTLPSIIFWSSTLGKDPIVLLGIAMYFFGVTAIYRTSKTRYLIVIGLGVALAMLMRTWMGAIMLAPLGALIFARLKRISAKVILIVSMAGALYAAIGQSRSNFEINSTQDLVAFSNGLLHGTVEGGSTVEFEAQLTSVSDMIKFAPLGAFTALFRPLPGEIRSAFGMAAGFESLFLLGLMVMAVRKTRIKELRDPMVAWLILLILIWSSAYGFASYKNLGTAVRFKLQILPLLYGLLLYLVRSRAPVIPDIISKPHG